MSGANLNQDLPEPKLVGTELGTLARFEGFEDPSKIHCGPTARGTCKHKRGGKKISHYHNSLIMPEAKQEFFTIDSWQMIVRRFFVNGNDLLRRNQLWET